MGGHCPITGRMPGRAAEMRRAGAPTEGLMVRRTYTPLLLIISSNMHVVFIIGEGRGLPF